MKFDKDTVQWVVKAVSRAIKLWFAPAQIPCDEITLRWLHWLGQIRCSNCFRFYWTSKTATHNSCLVKCARVVCVSCYRNHFYYLVVILYAMRPLIRRQTGNKCLQRSHKIMIYGRGGWGAMDTRCCDLESQVFPQLIFLSREPLAAPRLLKQKRIRNSTRTNLNKLWPGNSVARAADCVAAMKARLTEFLNRKSRPQRIIARGKLKISPEF